MWTELCWLKWKGKSIICFCTVCQHVQYMTNRQHPVCHVDLCAGRGGQWHRPYSRISDVDTRASAQSASHLTSDDIHRFILWGTCPRILLFKLPLVCFKILIQIQILARWRECIKTFRMLGFFILFFKFLWDRVHLILVIMHHILVGGPSMIKICRTILLRTCTFSRPIDFSNNNSFFSLMQRI